VTQIYFISHHHIGNYWNKLLDSVVLASSASCLKKACVFLLEMLAWLYIVSVILLDIYRLDLIPLGIS